jgi:hypothetical protein
VGYLGEGREGLTSIFPALVQARVSGNGIAQQAIRADMARRQEQPQSPQGQH